jgi:sigma-B regulation protein RsbU (phosphoserine phosphatase)
MHITGITDISKLFAAAEHSTVDILGLFASTEVFVFVFMEVSFNVAFVRRVLFKEARWYDYIFCILLFGGFSIFGTYTGIKLDGGAISSIRDLGPMVAGLIGGPIIGVGAGLVGGIHRYLQGGITDMSCSLATVLAGLIAGLIYQFRHGKILNMWIAVGLAVAVEFIHGVLAMLISKPTDIVWEIVKVAIPAMMIANGLCILLAGIATSRAMEAYEIRKHTILKEE